MKRVLSIAGGGMRGVGALVFAGEIVRRTGRPLWECFDLIVGTSTGGIIACLAAAGRGVEECREFYFTAGPRIFRSGALRRLYSAGGVLHTKYPGEVLAGELRRCIGDVLLRDGRCDVMVTSAERRRQEVMVKSWREEWRDMPLALAALMTASAPTYFPQAEFMHGGERCAYLDGGLVRNDPCACAAHEALMRWRDEEILHVALGTGVPRVVKPFSNGGAAFWAGDIFDGKTTLDSRFDTKMCEDWEVLHGPRYRHERFDFSLAQMPAMDAADRESLEEIEYMARHAAIGEYRRLGEVALKLL